jgi:putative endonuclease
MAGHAAAVYVSGVDRRRLGQIGEGAAAAALSARGDVLLCRNVRTRYGEIDLVAVHGNVLIFVEVKTRTSDRFGAPWEAVHPRKQHRLVRLARAFMHDRGMGDRICRFDVAAVLVGRDGRVVKVEIVSDAFGAVQ